MRRRDDARVCAAAKRRRTSRKTRHRRHAKLIDMTDHAQSATTISNIGVAMFTVADQDAAIEYYTKTLGWELRADIPFGDGAGRWVEVAPPGSAARLALNAPMGDWGPGGSSVGVETPDIRAEYARVKDFEGVTTGEMMGGEGPVPPMFNIIDPDGNHIWVVQPG
jgi:catechol 2,3-dioxygenase-like lactoylglutathione lyase family enzyme